MNLLLQTTAPASGGGNSVSGKQGDTSVSADFSRMLARKFVETGENPAEIDPSVVRDIKDRGRDVPERKSGDGQNIENEADPGTRTNDTTAENHPSSLPEGDGSLTGSSLPWSPLPGFLAAIEPFGMLNFSGPALGVMEAIPVDSPSGMASEIVAQFTDRNGMQTLTLKLDPEHLGRVEVRLQAKGDQLSVRLLADNREAETALRQNIKELTDAIQEKTGKYQQVDVRVELKSQENSGQKSTEQEKPGDEARQQAGKESQGNWREDSEPKDPGNTTVDNDRETPPDQWAQGG